jgi:hypothetical protein
MILLITPQSKGPEFSEDL